MTNIDTHTAHAQSETNDAHDSDVLDMTVHDLVFGWGLLQTYGEALDDAQPNAYGQPQRTLPERLAALLVTMGDEEGHLHGVSHEAFAGCLGTQRETVAAILRTFQRQDLIRLSYRHIAIIDRSGLQEIADIWS